MPVPLPRLSSCGLHLPQVLHPVCEREFLLTRPFNHSLWQWEIWTIKMGAAVVCHLYSCNKRGFIKCSRNEGGVGSLQKPSVGRCRWFQNDACWKESHGSRDHACLSDESYVGAQIPHAPGRVCGVWSSCSDWCGFLCHLIHFASWVLYSLMPPSAQWAEAHSGRFVTQSPSSEKFSCGLTISQPTCARTWQCTSQLNYYSVFPKFTLNNLEVVQAPSKLKI